MKYYQPLDKPDTPDAPYQNGNDVTGEEGSLPDARGFEATQREIVNTITGAGLTPAAEDQTQLKQAIEKYTADESERIINVMDTKLDNIFNNRLQVVDVLPENPQNHVFYFIPE